MQKLVLYAMLLMLCLTQVNAAEEQEKPDPKTSAYLSLGDPFILNLSGGTRLVFLQLSADVLVGDVDSEEAIKIHLPAIRHSLIMLLSEQRASDIKSPDKREEIRQLAASQVRTLIEDLSGNSDVNDILFSSILVQ